MIETEKGIIKLNIIDMKIEVMKKKISLLHKERKTVEDKLIGKKIIFDHDNKLSVICGMTHGLKEIPPKHKWEIKCFPGCWISLENKKLIKYDSPSISVRECANYFRKKLIG